MATRIGRCSWVCCLLAAVAIGALSALGYAESQVIEAAVRVLPAKEPALYLRFRNNKLWMATSQAGLEKATPIRAARIDLNRREDVGIEYRSYDFPETKLPLSLPGVHNLRAAFFSSREIGRGNDAPANTPEDRTRVGAMFSLSRRDRSGAAWTYTLHSTAESDTAKVPAQRLELALPQLDPDGLRLEVVIKVEQRNARIGLQVKSGDVGIDNVLKSDANSRATIEIADRDGRAVVSEKGDLQKFGFT
jgi:hypothetical protein